jgi:hypothetical protein
VSERLHKSNPFEFKMPAVPWDGGFLHPILQIDGLASAHELDKGRFPDEYAIDKQE